MTEQRQQKRSRPPNVTVNVTVDVQRSPTGQSIVHVSGELVGNSSAAMRRVVGSELMRSPELLALDLSEVTRIDSGGIDGLVSAATSAGESDISFCLIGVQDGPVGNALARAKLSELFEMIHDLSDA